MKKNTQAASTLRLAPANNRFHGTGQSNGKRTPRFVAFVKNSDGTTERIER